MDNKSTLISICTALGLVLTALSTHGDNAIKALSAVPLFLQAWASGMPLGVWSFFVAAVISLLVWISAIRYLPVGKGGKAPFVAANMIALLVGVAITVGQQYVADSRAAGSVLNAFFLGLIAGGIAPHIGGFLRGKARHETA